VRQHSVDTDTAVSITQQLVNDVTELPRNHRVLLDRKSASQTPEQQRALVMMCPNDDHLITH